MKIFMRVSGNPLKKPSFISSSIDLLKVNLIIPVLTGMFIENVYLLMHFSKANVTDRGHSSNHLSLCLCIFITGL